MLTDLQIFLIILAAILVYIVGMLFAYAMLERFDPVPPYDDRNKIWAEAWPIWILAVPLAAAVALVQLAMEEIKWREDQRRNDRHGHN